MKSLISPTAGGVVRAGLFLFLFACGGTPAQQKTAETAVVKVAEDVCKEAATQTGSPDWVALACAAGAGVVNIVMPKTEWQSIKARKVGSADAGAIVPVPGK